MDERIKALKREQADLIRTVHKHLDPIFAKCQALLQSGVEIRDENLQKSLQLSTLDSYINICADARRNFQQRFETLERRWAQSSRESPPPSYEEVVFSFGEGNAGNHDSNGRPLFDGRDDNPFSCKAKLKLTKPILPGGKHLSLAEKNRPISDFHGIWNFQSHGGWTYSIPFNCFLPPEAGLYRVMVEWRQRGEGVIEAGLGMLDESSLENLYSKVDEASTSSDCQFGFLTQTLNLHKKQGVWISLFRIEKHPLAENFTFHAFCVQS